MKNSLIVITGASSGIGATTAKIFSDAGYPLALFSRNKTAMEALNLPNSICLSVDVTDYNAMQTAIEIAEEKFGPVQGLINNAGFLKGGEFTEVTHDEHEKTIDVNIKGVLNGIECVLPSMRERKTGTIINISSVADRKDRPMFASYAASKAAIKSLSESLRMANAKYGIRICNMAPTKIDTPLVIRTDLDANQIIPPEAFAKAILWVYEQPQNICVRDIVFAPTYYEP
jgi:NADP-dependent 3-hydroxy acid dehydrogenase YdfG